MSQQASEAGKLKEMLLPTIDTTINTAYVKVGVPLWVPPSEVEQYLRYNNWSSEIALELCEWFARLWSMAFVAGMRDAKPVVVQYDAVARMLDKMGYVGARADELSNLLINNLPLLYSKGQSRRASHFSIVH